MGQAHRFAGPGGPYEGLTTIRRGRVDWTGKARLVPEMLSQPLRWRKPRRIFVNSMSDLFHDSLSNEEIAAVFGVMAAAPRHTFQVLTKRPRRAREWFEWAHWDRGFDHSEGGKLHVSLCDAMGDQGDWDPDDSFCEELLSNANEWPLPNVWLGCSIEDQETADARVYDLLDCPAAIRFVSYEPALGPVDFTRIRNAGEIFAPFNALQRWTDGKQTTGIDWVIVGGESGHGARPFDVAWARGVIEQCKTAGVACFVKQLGAQPVDSAVFPDPQSAAEQRGRIPDGLWRDYGAVLLTDRKGGNMSEWPEDLRVREFPSVQGTETRT